MDRNFMKVTLGKAAVEAHAAARRYIDIVSEVGIQQMHDEGNPLTDPDKFDPREVAEYAARSIGMDKNVVVRDYLDMLVLEGMIEMEKASS